MVALPPGFFFVCSKHFPFIFGAVGLGEPARRPCARPKKDPENFFSCAALRRPNLGALCAPALKSVSHPRPTCRSTPKKASQEAGPTCHASPRKRRWPSSFFLFYYFACQGHPRPPSTMTTLLGRPTRKLPSLKKKPQSALACTGSERGANGGEQNHGAGYADATGKNACKQKKKKTQTKDRICTR